MNIRSDIQRTKEIERIKKNSEQQVENELTDGYVVQYTNTHTYTYSHSRITSRVSCSFYVFYCCCPFCALLYTLPMLDAEQTRAFHMSNRLPWKRYVLFVVHNKSLDIRRRITAFNQIQQNVCRKVIV